MNEAISQLAYDDNKYKNKKGRRTQTLKLLQESKLMQNIQKIQKF